MSAVFEQIFQVGFLAAIIRIATPLAFATLGEMFSERAGVLNLGIEGIMLLSAMAGFTAAYMSGSLWLGVLAAIATGALTGALHAVFTVALGLSQHVCGIGVTLFSSGLAYFLYRLIFGQQSTPPAIKGFETLPIPLLSDIPVLNYQRHLFQERQVRSVTSNTRADARAFLDYAADHHIEVTTPEYPLGQADQALTDLSEGRIAGAAVLLV